MFAILALSQRLGNYENPPLAIILAVGAIGSLLWFAIQLLRGGVRTLREAKSVGDKKLQHKVYLGLLAGGIFAVAIIVALIWSPSRGVVLKPKPPPATALILRILGANVFESHPDRSLTGIVLDVQIRNSGTPSIATDWKLLVSSNGATPAVAQFTVIPNELRVPGNSTFLLRSSEALDAKTDKEPVRDAVVSGRLLFYVRLPKTVVLQDSTVLKVSVQDIAGNEFDTQQRMGDWLAAPPVPAGSSKQPSPRNADGKESPKTDAVTTGPGGDGRKDVPKESPQVANSAPFGIANSGTIGQATVNNFRSPQRTIAPVDRDLLVKTLSTMKASVHIFAPVSDNEAFTFAQELWDIFNEAQWTMVDGVRPVILAARMQAGVRVGFHSDDSSTITPDGQVDVDDRTLPGFTLKSLYLAHVKGLFVSRTPEITQGRLDILVTANPDALPPSPK